MVTSLLLFSCGGDSSESGSDSYSGPGSSWNFTLNGDGTFNATETDAEPDLELSGSWITTDSGFKVMTVDATNDASSVAVGSSGYAVDIPGAVFLLKPFSGTQILSMVRQGECPQVDISANWIMANKYAEPDAGRDLIGTFSYNSTTGSATLPNRYDIALNDLGSNNLGDWTCNDGIADIAEGRMYLTQIGSAMVHTGRDTPTDPTDDNFIVAMQTEALVNPSVIDDEYIGLVFETSTSGGDRIFPIYVSLSGGSGTGQQITDIAANTLDTDTVTINYSGTGLGVDIPSDGFVSATIDGSTLRCIANTDVNGSGKNYLYCVGENPGEAGKLYNLLMLSK